MRRLEFGDWGKELPESEFWRAVAAAGVAYAAGDEPIIAAPVQRNEPILWTWPQSEDYRGFLETIGPAAVWLERWKLLAGVHLALGRLFDNAGELIEWFRASGIGTYVRIEAGAVGFPDWQWPMRFGFTADFTSAQTRRALEDEQSRHETIKTLTTIESEERLGDQFEFLIVGGPLEQAAAQIRDLPIPVRAACVVVFDSATKNWTQEWGRVTEILRLTAASGVLVIPVPPEASGPVFTDLVWMLSHDVPLSGAQPGILFAHPSLIHRCRIRSFLRKTAQNLAEQVGRPMDIHSDLAWALGIESRHQDAADVGERLLKALDDRVRLFDRENHGATWAVSLHKKIARSTPLEFLAAPAADRFVQAQFFETRDGQRLRVESWQASGELLIDVFIDRPVEGAISSDEAFPEPEGSSGHLLTVVLSEPRLLEEPLVRQIFLPREGASDVAEFALAIPPEVDSIQARIIVLHRNRVMQTLMLQANRNERPVLRVEMPVRPGMRNMDRQRPFDLSMVLNHTTDGVPQATLGAGYQFATFSIERVDAAIEEIEARINGVPWSDVDYQSLEGAGTSELLRFLARKGSALHAQFNRYLTESLRARPASHVQVVSKESGARLPIEFFYERKPPKATAELCKNARTALASGKCGSDCTDTADVICPLGFWCFSKVIENHRFTPQSAEQTGGRAYALRYAKPGDREQKLPSFDAVLTATSAKVKPESRELLANGLNEFFPAKNFRATSWQDWADKVKTHSPGVLLLVPHTEMDQDGIPAMELEADLLASINLDTDHVGRRPVAILLGCNTDNKALPHENFVPYFSDCGAAIVVSTISKVLGRNAAPLANLFLAQLSRERTGDESFGSAMLRIRRQAMLDGQPVALVLKSYGDADWRL